MKNPLIYRHFAVTLLLISLISYHTPGQSMEAQIISSAGNAEVKDGLQISWTLGEVVIGFLPTSNLTLASGFQATQTIEELVTGIELPSYASEIKVYPNPVTHLLQLQIPPDTQLNLTLELMDYLGRKLPFERFQFQKEHLYRLDLSHLTPGTYYLAVYQQNLRPVKVFKLIKR